MDKLFSEFKPNIKNTVLTLRLSKFSSAGLNVITKKYRCSKSDIIDFISKLKPSKIRKLVLDFNSKKKEVSTPIRLNNQSKLDLDELTFKLDLKSNNGHPSKSSLVDCLITNWIEELNLTKQTDLEIRKTDTSKGTK